MNIQDVANQTGLTKKEIRYYESVNLIKVSNKEYTQDHVRYLNFTKVLRSIAWSVREIELVINNPEHWQTMIENTKYWDDDILMNHLRTHSFNENLMGNLEPSNWLGEGHHLSLSSTFIRTLVCLGLIVYLLVISNGNKVFVLLSIVIGALIMVQWYHYGVDRGKKPSKIMNVLVSIVHGISVLILFFGSMVLIEYLRQTYFIPSADYVYVSNYPWLVFILLIEGFILLTAFGNSRIHNSDFEFYVGVSKWLKKYMVLFIVINVLIVYVYFTAVTVVNRDGTLKRYSPFDLKGSSHEVIGVDVKYRKSGLKYRLKSDSFTINIGNGTFVSDDSETYIEIEELDKLYVDKGLKKQVSGKENVKNCNLEAQYCERFERILANE